MTPHRTVKPCGCIVTTEPGHVHTKLCEQHRAVTWNLRNGSEIRFKPDNLDLVGG
jgi:hypothetical protein